MSREQHYTLEEIFKWLGEKKITSVRDMFESKYDLTDDVLYELKNLDIYL